MKEIQLHGEEGKARNYGDLSTDKSPKAQLSKVVQGEEDGKVHKVFFSSLTPNQEVESAHLNNCCLCFVWAAFSVAMNTSWNFLSNFLFFAGNVCYVWISLNDLHNDATGEFDDDLFNMLNFSGAILFLLNPVSDFLANWAENKAIEINESLHDADFISSNSDPPSLRKRDSVDSERHEMVSSENATLFTMSRDVDWNKWVAILFFFGSLLYLWQAFLDAYDEEAVYYDALDLIASHVFLIDSILAIIAWEVGRRADAGTSRQRWIFVLNPHMLDWSGWGDLLFLLGSILDAAVSYMHPPTYSARLIHTLELSSNLLWMVDAMLYTIGYCFGQDLRRKFGNKEYTSLAHVEDLEHMEAHSRDALGINEIELT